MMDSLQIYWFVSGALADKHQLHEGRKLRIGGKAGWFSAAGIVRWFLFAFCVPVNADKPAFSKRCWFLVLWLYSVGDQVIALFPIVRHSTWCIGDWCR
jgi:hypothetical protein